MTHRASRDRGLKWRSHRTRHSTSVARTHVKYCQKSILLGTEVKPLYCVEKHFKVRPKRKYWPFHREKKNTISVSCVFHLEGRYRPRKIILSDHHEFETNSCTFCGYFQIFYARANAHYKLLFFFNSNHYFWSSNNFSHK